jgi:hypothetical protein
LDYRDDRPDAAGPIGATGEVAIVNADEQERMMAVIGSNHGDHSPRTGTVGQDKGDEFAPPGSARRLGQDPDAVAARRVADDRMPGGPILSRPLVLIADRPVLQVDRVVLREPLLGDYASVPMLHTVFGQHVLDLLGYAAGTRGVNRLCCLVLPLGIALDPIRVGPRLLS